MAERRGIMLVLCAPSGTGKSTLCKRLLEEFPSFRFSISCTTRKPRGEEKDGIDYHFLTKEEFIARRDAGFFAEWAEVHGNFYGTPRQATLDLLSEGHDVLFDIDVQGAAQLRKSMGQSGSEVQARYVFILPPSRAVLEQRLRSRGTDAEECIITRLANAAKELEAAPLFDACIVNDNLDTAYDALRASYLAATLHPACRPNAMQQLLAEWK